MKNYKYDERDFLLMRKKRTVRSLLTAGILLSLAIIIVIATKFYHKESIASSNTLEAADVNMSKIICFDSSKDDYVYDYSQIKRDFGSVNFVTGSNRLFIKDDALCIKYPSGTSGSSNSGAIINSKIEKSKEYYMEYEIYVDGNGDRFDWNNGGMLSGLAGGKFYSGKEKAISGDGYHAMLVYNNYGYLYPCIYSANDVEVEGSIFNKIGQIKEGVWNRIKMYVQVNDSNKSNGVFRVWLDDKLCYNNEDIRYTTEGTPIDISNLQAYVNESTNGTSHEEFVYIDNFHVYQ